MSEERFQLIAPGAKTKLAYIGGLYPIPRLVSEVLSSLAVPVRPQYSFARHPRYSVDRRFGILDLPPEIHRLIFSRMVSVVDVLCLGLTCQYFWSLGREHIRERSNALLRLAQWAGQRIVSVSGNADPGDYLLGLFTAEELDELNRKTFGPFKGPVFKDRVLLSYSSLTEYSISKAAVSSRGRSSLVRNFARSYYRQCEDRIEPEDTVTREVLKLATDELIVRGMLPPVCYPRDQPWILRNLTTKEYVHQGPVNLEYNDVYHLDIFYYFGKVVLLRIHWSSFTGEQAGHPSNLSKGVWAGHRFDITTLARHEAETEGEQWKDVSEEVATECASTWGRKAAWLRKQSDPQLTRW